MNDNVYGFHIPRRGAKSTFSQKEDIEIIKSVLKNGVRWTTIASEQQNKHLLFNKRTAEQIRLRFRTLCSETYSMLYSNDAKQVMAEIIKRLERHLKYLIQHPGLNEPQSRSESFIFGSPTENIAKSFVNIRTPTAHHNNLNNSTNSSPQNVQGEQKRHFNQFLIQKHANHLESDIDIESEEEDHDDLMQHGKIIMNYNTNRHGLSMNDRRKSIREKFTDSDYISSSSDHSPFASNFPSPTKKRFITIKTTPTLPRPNEKPHMRGEYENAKKKKVIYSSEDDGFLSLSSDHSIPLVGSSSASSDSYKAKDSSSKLSIDSSSKLSRSKDSLHDLQFRKNPRLKGNEGNKEQNLIAPSTFPRITRSWTYNDHTRINSIKRSKNQHISVPVETPAKFFNFINNSTDFLLNKKNEVINSKKSQDKVNPSSSRKRIERKFTEPSEEEKTGSNIISTLRNGTLPLEEDGKKRAARRQQLLEPIYPASKRTTRSQTMVSKPR